mgnify:CR=1 FL=1
MSGISGSGIVLSLPQSAGLQSSYACRRSSLSVLVIWRRV